MSQYSGPGRVAGARRVAAAGTGAVLAAAAVLAGTGPAAATPRAPVLAFTPSPYDYGRVTAGQTATQTFTLANTGGQATSRLKVTLAGPAAFTITGRTCGRPLRPGKSCTVTVQFAPTSAGRITATLTAASKKSRVTAIDALTGTGTTLGSAPGHIYWTETMPAAVNGTINQAGLDGSNPQPFPAPGQPFGIAVDASHIYWTDLANGTVNEANLDGSSAHIIVNGENHPTGVAVDASHLYWTDHYSGSGISGAGTINEADLNGNDPHAIVTGQIGPSGVAVDANHIYWASTGLYVPALGSINVANLDGTSPQAIVSDQNGPTMVALGP